MWSEKGVDNSRSFLNMPWAQLTHNQTGNELEVFGQHLLLVHSTASRQPSFWAHNTHTLYCMCCQATRHQHTQASAVAWDLCTMDCRVLTLHVEYHVLTKASWFDYGELRFTVFLLSFFAMVAPDWFSIGVHHQNVWFLKLLFELLIWV